MWQEYPNTSEMELRFDFSTPLGMSKVASKYLRVGYVNMEDKTRINLTPLSCLDSSHQEWRTFLGGSNHF